MVEWEAEGVGVGAGEGMCVLLSPFVIVVGCWGGWVVAIVERKGGRRVPCCWARGERECIEDR